MFQLEAQEFTLLRSQIVTSNGRSCNRCSRRLPIRPGWKQAFPSKKTPCPIEPAESACARIRRHTLLTQNSRHCCENCHGQNLFLGGSQHSFDTLAGFR